MCKEMNENQNKEIDVIIEESVKPGVEKILAAFAGDDEPNFEIMEWLLDPKEILQDIFQSYITIVEGSSCSRDKAGFIAKKLLESIKKREILPLQEFDKKGHKRFCCPNTLKDTKEAYDAYLDLVSINRIPNILEKGKKINRPWEEIEEREAREMYLEELATMKKIEKPTTLREYIQGKLQKIGEDASFIVSVVYGETGLPTRIHYDGLVGWKIIDELGAGDAEIDLIEELGNDDDCPFHKYYVTRVTLKGLKGENDDA